MNKTAVVLVLVLFALVGNMTTSGNETLNANLEYYTYYKDQNPNLHASSS